LGSESRRVPFNFHSHGGARVRARRPGQDGGELPLAIALVAVS
jgi:hypothetical protein